MWFSQQARQFGSNRVMANWWSSIQWQREYYTFGQDRMIGQDSWGWGYKFTGMQDGDYTLFRRYDNLRGRWLSPDPVAGDVMNPQSLNRYAYVTNNPTNLIDPLGLQGGSFWAETWDPCSDPLYLISHAQCPGAPWPPLPPIPPWWIPYPGGGGAAPSPPPSPGRSLPPMPADSFANAGVLTAVPPLAIPCLSNPTCAAILVGIIGGILVYKGVEAVADTIHQARAEQRLIRYIADKYCVDRRLLGDEVEKEKGLEGRGPKDNLSKERIEQIARRLPRKPDCRQ